MSEKVSGYGFNGEYFDAATGMLNLRARQYEPGQARFSQKDSEKGHVANARSLNAYLYCYNDGINYFDASGAAPEAVRNNTTVDAGDGGSYAVRSAKAQAEQARKDAARRATKPTNRERIAQDNPEEMARSEYIRKQGSAPTVGGSSLWNGGMPGACTEGRSSPDYTMLIYDGITITIDHNPDLSTKNEAPPALYEVTVRDGITIIAHNIPSGATVTVRDGITIIEHPIEEQEGIQKKGIKQKIADIAKELDFALTEFQDLTSETNVVSSSGYNISFSPFGIVGGSLSVYLSRDLKGNLSLQYTIEVDGSTTGSAVSVSRIESITFAPSIKEMNGEGIAVGGSYYSDYYGLGGNVTINRSINEDGDNYYGFGTGVGAEGHVGKTWTNSIPYTTINLYDIGHGILSRIEQWGSK